MPQIDTMLLKAEKNAYDSALAYGTAYEALALAKEAGSEYYRGLSQRTLGVLFYVYGNHDESILYYDSARIVFEKQKDTANLARTERLIGAHYDVKGRLTESMSHVLRSVTLYKAINDMKGLTEAYLSMAVLQQGQGKDDKAIITYQRAIEFAKKSGNNKALATIYNNLGSLLRNASNLDTALACFELALEHHLKTNNLHGAQSTYHNMGSLENDRGNQRKALDYMHQSLNMSPGSMLVADNLITFLAVGFIYTNIEKYDSAEIFLNRALEVALNENIHSNVGEAYRFLSDLEVEKGNYKKALEYHKKFQVYTDSVEMDQFNNAMLEMETKFNLQVKTDENKELKEKEAALAELVHTKEKNQIVLVVFVALLLVLLSVVWISNRRLHTARARVGEAHAELKKKSLQLEHNNRRLEQIMLDKNDLVSVLAHDLRSPLGKAQSLIELMRLGKDDKEKEGYVHMLDSMLRDGLALIQDLIDLSMMTENSEGVDHSERIGTFTMPQVMQRLSVSFQSHLKNKNLQLEMDLDSTPMVNRLDLCERICDNLFSNAIKYSFPNGKIHVKSFVEGDNMHLEITDNGPGFLEKEKERLFQRFSRLSARPTGIESSTGLGLFIAKKLAESIYGDIHLLSQEGEPARFSVLMQLNLKNQLQA